ncbi:MAG: hypothetical protein IT379_32040 [Deltaproteobacteria bacterium]|nr:hypothetical protein [Deltaproteobacteria bacterium]
MSDADHLLALIERSRREECPRRRTGVGKTLTARLMPIVPCSPASGVSRDDIVKRLSKWAPGWDRPRVDGAVKVLVDRGVMTFGPKGLYARKTAVEIADEVF